MVCFGACTSLGVFSRIVRGTAGLEDEGSDDCTGFGICAGVVSFFFFTAIGFASSGLRNGCAALAGFLDSLRESSLEEAVASKSTSGMRRFGIIFFVGFGRDKNSSSEGTSKMSSPSVFARAISEPDPPFNSLPALFSEPFEAAVCFRGRSGDGGASSLESGRGGGRAE